MPDEIMTPAQAAAYLQVTRKSIYKWCANGKLPHLKVGRSVRIARATLDGMVRENGAKSDDEILYE